MDRVKFGRALGYGARHAVKTVMKAADAASTPNPTPVKPSSPRGTAMPSGARPPIEVRGIPDVQTVKAAGKQAKSSLVTPVVRFSSVVWLQVTGVFFALVAFTMGMAAWKARAGFQAAANSQGAMKVYAYVAVCALFTYFTVSSFVRAARR
jgi:hypothetical protein